MFLFPVGEEITKSCPHLVLIPLYLSIWHKKSFRNKLIVSIESNVLLSAVNFYLLESAVKQSSSGLYPTKPFSMLRFLSSSSMEIWPFNAS